MTTMSIQPVFLECGDCGECHLCSPGPESFGWQARPLSRGDGEVPFQMGRAAKLHASDRCPEVQVLDVKSLPPGAKWAGELCLDCGEISAPDSCRCRRG